MDLFVDRTSCHKWWLNQFRLLLSSLTYILRNTRRIRFLLQKARKAAQFANALEKHTNFNSTGRKNQ